MSELFILVTVPRTTERLDVFELYSDYLVLLNCDFVIVALVFLFEVESKQYLDPLHCHAGKRVVESYNLARKCVALSKCYATFSVFIVMQK